MSILMCLGVINDWLKLFIHQEARDGLKISTGSSKRVTVRKPERKTGMKLQAIRRLRSTVHWRHLSLDSGQQRFR
ncbi:Autophagy-related protein 18d [Trichinella pseudospiralis]